MLSENDIFANVIFLNAVLPNLKTVVNDLPKYNKIWKGKNAICQISAVTAEGKAGTHFLIENGKWTVKRGVCDTRPTIDLEFSSIPHLNQFFQGKSRRLPRLKGWHHLSVFFAFMRTLLKMASLLNMTQPPSEPELKALLVKIYLYLLPSGISQLNKAGYQKIKAWSQLQPNRVFSFEVENCPQVSTFLRVKAGNTKAGRGEYRYSAPFFTMRFKSFDAALGILLSKDDMVEAQISGRLFLDGAPEVGLVIGDFLLTVGKFAKGLV